jgi:hypothetical protein
MKHRVSQWLATILAVTLLGSTLSSAAAHGWQLGLIPRNQWGFGADTMVADGTDWVVTRQGYKFGFFEVQRLATSPR